MKRIELYITSFPNLVHAPCSHEESFLAGTLDEERVREPELASVHLTLIHIPLNQREREREPKFVGSVFVM